MKKFILPVLSILFASFQANAEEQHSKLAGKIICYGHSAQGKMFDIKYFEGTPQAPQNCKKNCLSIKINKNMLMINQIIDSKNHITYTFINQYGETKNFSFVADRGFSCDITEN